MMKCSRCMEAWFRSLPAPTRKDPQLLQAQFDVDKDKIEDAITVYYHAARCLAHWKELA